MATAPILRYALTTDPFPLQASPQSGNLTTATLTVVGSNPTSAPVTLQGLIVTLPVGNNSTDLTPDATSISPIPPPNWTLNETVPSTGQVKYIFYPTKGHGAVGLEGLNFVFNNVAINRQTGTVAVEITEGSNNCKPPNCPTKTLDLTKFPNGWGEVSFWAYPYPPIMSGKDVQLYWHGPEGATYTIRYSFNNKIVKVPKSGQPALANSGQYPGTNAPPLKLKQTTTFYLTVEKTIDNQPYQAQKYLPVVVVEIPPPPPQITLLSAKPHIIKKNGKNTLVTLSWTAKHTTQLEVLGPGGGRVFYDKQAQQFSTTFWVTDSQSFVATAWGLPGYTGPPTLQQTAVYSPPQILKFTGEIQTASSSEISLVLNWEVRYVTECKISGIPETTVPPIGPITITPSVEHPLQSTYTLTATNPAGTASSQLTVVWGKEVLKTTKLSVPFGIAVSPDGTLIYVANQENNGVSVLDTTTLQPVGKPFVDSNPIIWEPWSKEPVKIAVSSPKTAVSPSYASNVFVTNMGSNTLLVLGTAYKKPPKIKAYAHATALGKEPAGVAVSPDGTRVFVTNMGSNTLSVLDVSSLLPVTGTPIPVGKGPNSIAVLPDGSRVIVTNYLDNTLSVLDAKSDPIKVIGKPIPVGNHPTDLAVSPDGLRVFVASGVDNTVSVLDVTANSIKVTGKPIKVGANPLALSITPDGERVFVTNSDDSTVSVLEVTSNSVKVTGEPIPGIEFPGYIAVSPNGAYIFITSFRYGTVSVVVPTSVTGGSGS